MTETLLISRPRLDPEIRLLIAAVVYTALAALFSWTSYIAIWKQYAIAQFFVLPWMLAFGLLAASLIASPRTPVTWLRSLLASRAKGAAVSMLLFCFGIAAFSTFKHHIPEWLPFFADRPLADLDDVLHQGQPWRHLHAIAPEWAPPILAFLYGPLWFLQWFGVFLFAAFLPNDRLRVRYLLSFGGTILLLGTIMRAAGASAGPIFYDRMFGSDRFAELITVLAGIPQGSAMLVASDYLYVSYIDDSAVFGAGISAMPSIHVAMAVLNALFVGSLNRWLGLIGWLFAGSILFGSVFFGWHYALDGYVSIAAVLLIWRHAKQRGQLQ